MHSLSKEKRETGAKFPRREDRMNKDSEAQNRNLM